VADHYQYLACIGPIALAAAAMELGLRRLAWEKPFLRPALCGALLLTLGALTWRQCGVYAGPETLWRATLARNPDSGLAHNNLGAILRQKGALDGAITQYQAALETMPDNESIHFNLARALYLKGRVADAIAQFQSALQLAPADVEVQNNLAWLLATARQTELRNGEKAVQLARQAGDLSGGKNPVILGTLAAALAEAGRFPEAVATAQRALLLAQAQTNTRLAAQLQMEINLYQAGRAYHQ
jgi:Flp pilus assembly protein TadD